MHVLPGLQRPKSVTTLTLVGHKIPKGPKSPLGHSAALLLFCLYPSSFLSPTRKSFLLKKWIRPLEFQTEVPTHRGADSKPLDICSQTGYAQTVAPTTLPSRTRPNPAFATVLCGSRPRPPRSRLPGRGNLPEELGAYQNSAVPWGPSSSATEQMGGPEPLPLALSPSAPQISASLALGVPVPSGCLGVDPGVPLHDSHPFPVLPQASSDPYLRKSCADVYFVLFCFLTGV